MQTEGRSAPDPGNPPDPAPGATPGPTVRVAEVADERDPAAAAALELITQSFAARERHATGDLLSEIAERRLDALSSQRFHMLTAHVEGDEDPAGVIIGVYLDGVNAGFVSYLAVRERYRGRRIGRVLRPRLVDQFREDARHAGHADLAWVLGEVRLRSPWLRRLVRTRGAIPFDLTYYHPGMSLDSPEPYVLYRQPVADTRLDLPVAEVRRLLFAIYRRAYRVRYPLQREAFNDMMDQLDQRASIGVHPDFRELLERAR
jgi:GNAT superfamily N-acetyltransferase